METNETPVIQSQMGSDATEGKNLWQRFLGIFLEPAETLKDVAVRPTWLVPLLFSLVLLAIPYVLQMEKVPREARVKAIAEQASKFTGGDPKQIETALLAQRESNYTKYQSVYWMFGAGIPVTMAIAGILLGAFLLAGSSVSFKNSLAAYCWSGVPPSLAMSVFAVFFLFAKDPSDLNPLDPLGNIISHLGVLLDSKVHPVLYSLLNSIDLFSFWRIYLLGLGFSAATYEKSSTGKCIGVITLLWAIYVLGKTALSAIWS